MIGEFSDSLQDLNTLCERYGIEELPVELERLRSKSRRKQARRRFVKSQISELEAEVRVLASELSGIDVALDLLAGATAQSIRSIHSEAWSPVPVLAFRVWKCSSRGLFGLVQQWESPRLVAYCSRRGTTREVPHTDGGCPHPSCGIYAAKNLARLLAAHERPGRTSLAVGLVALSGKVVEHEHGYRGAVAEVLALAYPSADGLQMSHRREEIQTVFRQGCQEQTVSPEHETEAAVDRIVRYLTEQRERRENWTLESN